MIPLAIPNIGELEGRYLQSCVDENFVSTVGRFVTWFEEQLATLSGTQLAAATGSGTQALHLALHALGVTWGDLVIVPSFTFIATANAIVHCGAAPWLMDIESTSWTLDPRAVADALDRSAERRNGCVIHKPSGRRIAAIMPVYTLGTPADMDELNSIASDYGLPIVADAAAAIGVTFRGRKIGELADLTAYSFNGNKTITSGGGGALVGRDTELIRRIKHLSSTARATLDYDHDEVGFNYRMTNLEAAVGCAQMQRLQEFLNRKREIRTRYDSAFRSIKGVAAFPAPEDRESTNWFSGLVIDDPARGTVRDLCAHLRNSGIEARPFWKPVHLQAPYLEAPVEEMPVTDAVWSKIVTLPCSTSLSDRECDQVIEAVTSYFDN